LTSRAKERKKGGREGEENKKERKEEIRPGRDSS